MLRVLDWLSRHPLINGIVITLYYLAVVLPHKRFGTFLNTQVFKGITRTEYNQIVLVIASIILIIFSGILIRNLNSHKQRKLISTYLVLNILLAAVVMCYLFVINIEVVHYPQYALFAIISYPLLNNLHQSLIWTTIAGAIDEAYQYFYLAPKDTYYYDMNDVVTNLIGAVFGLLLIWSYGRHNHRNTPFFKSSGFYAICGVLLVVLIACWSGLLSIYPSDTSSYQLLRQWPEGFWTSAKFDVNYHIIQPLEGAVIVVVLWFIYSKIGTTDY